MYVRNRPNAMTRNPKVQIIELSKPVILGLVPLLMVVLVRRDIM